jgi:hypothetical protein
MKLINNSRKGSGNNRLVKAASSIALIAASIINIFWRIGKLIKILSPDLLVFI